MITSPPQIKPFLDEHFLLETETAKQLYHDYAKSLPIIDYHNHLPPEEIAANKRFENLTKIWLNGDHYKWRAMRTNGIPENYITGSADDYSKFEQWAATVPYTMRNPLYHWTHLELNRYFGIKDLLNPKTSRSIYDRATAQLKTPDFSVGNLMHRMNVEVICTTDDPCDDLRYHQEIRESDFTIKTLPAFRPDKAILINRDGFTDYIQKLGVIANREIISYFELLEVLQKRIDFFHQMGGRLSDHGLEQLYAADFTIEELDRVFRKKLAGQSIFPGEAVVYMSGILFHLCEMYQAKGWTQQFHLGALRNTNSRLVKILGPDTGFDSIGDFSQAAALSRFLDKLDSNDQLAPTILYNLNPGDNAVLASMIGNFNDGSIVGKMQFGSAWWFLDQKDGMEKQINTLSNLGLLSRFIGMLTDSRSFLSFPRHEYFRRILCNLFGSEVENGELPNDIEWIGKLISDICYHNAKAYFKF